MKKIIKWFHSLNFRSKIIISLIVTGVVPFMIFSMLIVAQTLTDLGKNDEHSFNSAFISSVSKMERQIDKIENAVDVLAIDSVVTTVLTGEYNSEYEKYYQMVNHFDIIDQTILLTTPEIVRIEFYVPNSLAEARVNFQPLEAFEEDPNYGSVSAQGDGWYYDSGRFYYYKKVFSTYDLATYAILKASVASADIIEADFAGGASIDVSLRGKSICASGVGGQGYMHQSRSFMGESGVIDAYKSVDISAATQGTMILVVAGTVAGFVLLIAIINILSKLLVKRLERLNTQLSTAVESDFQTVLTEDYNDEIGQLTATANKMIADTRSLIDDVYRSRIKQKEYEINALQAQLNPHFLYNVLSAVNWHAITSDNMEISGIVTSLSKFYRTVLNSGKSITTIKNEMENIEAYINIQSAIHSNSFDVSYSIDEKVYGYSMPNLIIQPLVENAIEHGIDHKTDGRGRLEITAATDGMYIVIRIVNNGEKISAEDMCRLSKYKSSGYGISNVNKRLKLFYGEEYSLVFTSDEITVAELRIPKYIKFDRKL